MIMNTLTYLVDSSFNTTSYLIYVLGLDFVNASVHVCKVHILWIIELFCTLEALHVFSVMADKILNDFHCSPPSRGRTPQEPINHNEINIVDINNFISDIL